MDRDTKDFALLPDLEIGLILACNYDAAPMGEIRNGVLDILLGEAPSDPRPSIALAFGEAYGAEGPDAAKALYRRIESEAASDYQFGDEELNQLGYYFLRQEKVADSIAVFRFNVELFPDVGNAHDSLGEAYMLDGQSELAIQSYRRALELEPENENARRMLTQLGAPASAGR